MKASRIHILVIILVALAFARADAADHSLTLTNDLKLKDIFDAGIRPRQKRAMNYYRCEFKANSFQFLFNDGRKIITKNGDSDVYVLSDDVVGRITFYERYNMTVDEATTRMKEYCGILGVSAASIDQKFKSYQDNPVYGDSFDFHNEIGDWIFWVSAENSFNREKPVWFIFQAGRKYKNQKEPKERAMNQPLQAPAGYEQYSMDPAPLGQGPKGPPILTPQELADQIRKELDEKRKQQDLSTSQTFPKPTVPASEQGPSVQYKASKSTLWSWIIGAIVFLVLAGGILFKFLRSNSKP